MKRLTRQIIRAARFLEQEAKEYVAAGRDSNDDEDRHYFGLRAKRMFGLAMCLRELAKTGNYPTRKRETELLSMQERRA